MNDPKQVINSVCWRYESKDKQWNTYPKNISSLINREYNRQQNIATNSQKYTPIFYQLNNGNQFKIDLSNLQQYDLQNNSVVNIEPQNVKKTEQLKYNKCCECHFKITPNMQICNVCNTQLPAQKNDNFSSQIIQNNNNNKSKSASKLMEVQPPKEQQPDIVDEFILCPSCGTKNKLDFNFCCECGFGLKESKLQTDSNEKEDVDIKMSDVSEKKNDLIPGQQNGNVQDDNNVIPGAQNEDNPEDDIIINEMQPGAVIAPANDNNNDNDSSVEIVD